MSGVRCTNRGVFIIILLITAFVLDGCSSAEIWMPFSDYSQNIRSSKGRATVIEHTDYDDRYPGFANDLCVFSGDVSANDHHTISSTSALLIDVNESKVLFSENAFERRYPASTTKILTAVVALKYLTPESVIKCTESVENVTVPGAVLLGLKSGDTMTLDQALHLCLLSSYNDVSIAIAEAVSGSVEEFADLMDREALALGCTGSDFENPSGLPDPGHYTTAYDLYLIFNEAIKDPFLLEVMQTNEYSTVIHTAAGSDKQVGSKNTNGYFRGAYTAPSNITILGGKTGTTDEAGHCLMLLIRDTTSKPYIAIVLGSDTTDDLYNEMSQMLNLCEVKVN